MDYCGPFGKSSFSPQNPSPKPRPVVAALGGRPRRGAKVSTIDQVWSRPLTPVGLHARRDGQGRDALLRSRFG